MFSFHKPRVYRSAEGCCICRAKSSSSRFTDSKKYEEDSVKCFDLREARHGEICNACVLLVKRFKRLPAGSNRHWGHVVDARAGPGMKSMTKFKKLKDDCTQASSNGSNDRAANNQKSLIPEKFSKIFKKNKKKVVKDKIKSQHIAAVASKPWESQSLPLTPESLDSDCDDVQYSPTRAIESASLKIRQAINRRGSSKRKCLPPKKFRNRNPDQVQFFDENLWVKRKSCCGIVFENKELGAIILDIQNYNPCAEHQRKKIVEIPTPTPTLAKPLPIASQLSAPQKFSIQPTPYQLPFNPPANRNPTPVLKKHHLFYKRQSESFPLGDMKQLNSNINNSNNNKNNNNNSPKTDFVLDFKVLPNSLPTSSAVKVAKLNPIDLGLHSSHLQITTSGSKMAAPFDHHQQAIHKLNGSKSNSFMHKVKSDTGKIVKHSLEKFNTLRLKPSELSDVKHMVKTVDKPFLIKPVSAVSHDKLKKMGLDNVPCSSSVQQSVATKFNDNSSDSGFDENLQDRKSVSPLQDDGEKKIMTIPVQTMYLASGVQIHGQHQNLLLTGNDVAAKILQNRKQIQNNRNGGVKIAQIVANGGAQKMRAIYSQPSEGAVITTVSSTSPNIMSIPSKTGTTTTSSSLLSSNNHLTTKTPTNIILNNTGDSSNVISTSVPSLNQKIILVKTKYNNNNNNNQSTCKN
ncbi:rho GTPase-activating protein gacU [Eupeodes corollae]|uniref:rho GTPase-activating protein gacU n=1 Tax=Eupeodes corollae TaxID=290404 RepID=UPI002490FACA|nr:rho GTPase-activating protein gacU [Eupeodes corollae]XP_055912410.1 rho GTPase-activating protein gacU [Eupeodes corollae]XP_055912411.1 rho GTPase-activating protein gacU [Eupeodes corollae]XP_055912412.1 rho GTPase-activating protein gacU [Eupeodes corollae]